MASRLSAQAAVLQNKDIVGIIVRHLDFASLSHCRKAALINKAFFSCIKNFLKGPKSETVWKEACLAMDPRAESGGNWGRAWHELYRARKNAPPAGSLAAGGKCDRCHKFVSTLTRTECHYHPGKVMHSKKLDAYGTVDVEYSCCGAKQHLRMKGANRPTKPPCTTAMYHQINGINVVPKKS